MENLERHGMSLKLEIDSIKEQFISILKSSEYCDKTPIKNEIQTAHKSIKTAYDCKKKTERWEKSNDRLPKVNQQNEILKNTSMSSRGQFSNSCNTSKIFDLELERKCDDLSSHVFDVSAFSNPKILREHMSFSNVNDIFQSTMCYPVNSTLMDLTDTVDNYTNSNCESKSYNSSIYGDQFNIRNSCKRKFTKEQCLNQNIKHESTLNPGDKTIGASSKSSCHTRREIDKTRRRKKNRSSIALNVCQNETFYNEISEELEYLAKESIPTHKIECKLKRERGVTNLRHSTSLDNHTCKKIKYEDLAKMNNDNIRKDLLVKQNKAISNHVTFNFDHSDKILCDLNKTTRHKKKQFCAASKMCWPFAMTVQDTYRH